MSRTRRVALELALDVTLTRYLVLDALARNLTAVTVTVLLLVAGSGAFWNRPQRTRVPDPGRGSRTRDAGHGPGTRATDPVKLPAGRMCITPTGR